jgi:hypothetical protein
MSMRSSGSTMLMLLGLVACREGTPAPGGSEVIGGKGGATTGGGGGGEMKPGSGGGGSGHADSGTVDGDGSGGIVAGAGGGGGAEKPVDGGGDDSGAGRGGSSDSGAGGIGTPSPTFQEVKTWAEAYKAAHPGNGGKDWDIDAKTPAQLAADPDARRLLAVCGPDQRPVFPMLAWEYGGSDHSWINPAASALVYCVYVPVKLPTSHWRYDSAAGRVTADIYVRFPEQNPCKDKSGKEQVAACIGDASNFEILVDIASLDDGVAAGLSLGLASTELELVLADGSKVQLIVNL